MALSRDARLVARVRRGDSSAFEALHARHQPAILAFCRHLTGNREDAEDAVQHTFLAAYRRIVGSDDELELRPWLFTVARNRSLSLLRARRERVVAAPDAAASMFDGLAVEVERRQELRDLVRDMSRLPESQRAALVLSQLEALSYREIGSVLAVPPEKVKALVFQARSSLASTREAREAPCLEIRSQIASARGAGLRRRLLRRHVGQCDGCREFEVAVLGQRRDLAILLPVAPSAGLGQAVLGGALGREGATTAGAGGGIAGAGGAGGGGLAGSLAALGGGGGAKLAVAAVVAGSGAAGAVAADLPARIQATVPIEAVERIGSAGPGSAPPAGESGGGVGGGEPGSLRGGGEHGRNRVEDRRGAASQGRTGQPGAIEPPRDDAIGEGASEGPPVAGEGPSGLPPGLAERDELPPGLAKRDELPPGIAKGRGQGDPRQGGGRGQGDSGGGGGSGNGNAGGQGNNAGQGNGNGGQGNAGGGQGNHAAPGSGDGQPGTAGGGHGSGGGQGHAGAGPGNSKAGGQGNNAGGQGNGSGNPH